MYVLNTERIPIKIWASDTEDGVFTQARNIANLPFAFRHVALMPDAHVGYGMPIGGVCALEDVIIPHAIGLDIGCGLGFINTSLKDIHEDILKQIMGKIRTLIPMGMNRHNKFQEKRFLPTQSVFDYSQVIYKELENALTSIGTLGGGNHFIEFQQDTKTKQIGVMIHSGSRNLGHKVGTYYNNKAKELNKKWFSSVPVSHELAFLPIDSKDGSDYMNDMDYCVKYAYANRTLMLNIIMSVMSDFIPHIEFDEPINIAHNYASKESHFKKSVIVHRKGATLARKNTICIIPGSQGSYSYIGVGLGNPDSFNSCSHGAGRVLGRKAAKQTLDFEKVKEKLDASGIIHSIRSKEDLDEAPEAYKDITVVMNNQKDLVQITSELKPLGVLKATGFEQRKKK